MKNKKQNQLGITLIALIITIIILLLLSGITIRAVISGGLISRANEAKFKQKMAEFRDDTNTYVALQLTTWQTEGKTDINTNKINAGEILKDAIDSKIVTDIKKEDVTTNIEEVIKGISNSDKNLVVVYKGELYYVSNENNKNNENQVKWCNEIGIKILGYKEPTGIVVKNGKYELVNGVYLCTPKLDEGFDESKTRYLEVNSQGNLTPGNWIDESPTNNWYDYKESKWANIYVENNGLETYYVWIPRYCFKLDQDTERSDVRFIDMDNSYKDAEGNVTPWSDLKEEGYQIPEAFWFDKNGNGEQEEDEELSGYWAMKYTVGEVDGNTTIDYDMVVIEGVVNIKNIRLNTTITNSNPIKTYTIALNGKIKQTINKEEDLNNIENIKIALEDMKAGDNVINVTGLNAGGEVVGSMTKTYSLTVANEPDTSGFNPDTTFYVTYDDNEEENSTIPISQGAPNNWYEYGESRWANIVTRNNGLETYYTWIPRYEFKLDQTNERSTVKFLSGTSRQKDSGYEIPEAFWFDKNGNGTEDDGEQLTGYWAMKYTAGE